MRTHHRGRKKLLPQKRHRHRVRVFLPRGNVHEVGVCLYPIREFRASLEAEAGGGLSCTAAGDRVVTPPSSGRWKPSSSCRYALAEATPGGGGRYPRPEPRDADGLCWASRRRWRSRDVLRHRAHRVLPFSVQVLRDGDDVVDGSGLAATSKGKAAAAAVGGGGGVKRRRGREPSRPSWSPPVVVVTTAAAAGGVVEGVLSALGGVCCPSPGISGDRWAQPPSGRAVLFSRPALLPEPHSGDLLNGPVVSKIELPHQARLHIDGGLEALHESVECGR